MNYTYDGFGNLTQNGSTTLSINPATNRINTTGYTYDANGNLTASPSATCSYDVANRLVSNGAAYDPSNRRIIDGSGYLYLYGEAGELLTKYQPVWSTSSQALIQGSPRLYFAGRMLADTTQGWTMTDRLGSVRLNQNGERSDYQPYGTETTSTSQNRAKFATYWRDAADLDYAEQRYYAPGAGSFFSPDPGGIKTANPRDPSSWNRYAYVQGGPVNFHDPGGLNRAAVECPNDPTTSNCSDPALGGGGFPTGFALIQSELDAYIQMVNDATAAAAAAMPLIHLIRIASKMRSARLPGNSA